MIINNNLAPVTQAVTDIYWKSEVNVARINAIVQYILEHEERLAAQLAAANARADAAEQRLSSELAKEPCQNCTHGKAWHEGGKCSNACHCRKYVAQLTSQSPHAGEILPQLIEYQAELHRDALRRLGEAQHGADELRRQLAEAQAELARVRAALAKIDEVAMLTAQSLSNEMGALATATITIASIATIRVIAGEALSAPPSQPVKE